MASFNPYTNAPNPYAQQGVNPYAQQQQMMQQGMGGQYAQQPQGYPAAYGMYNAQGLQSQNTSAIPLLVPKDQLRLEPKADEVHVCKGPKGGMVLGERGMISEKVISDPKHVDHPKMLRQEEENVSERIARTSTTYNASAPPVLSSRVGPGWFDDKGQLLAASTLVGINECVLEYRDNIGVASQHGKPNAGGRPPVYMVTYAHIGIKKSIYEWFMKDIAQNHGVTVTQNKGVELKDDYYWLNANIDNNTMVACIIDEGAGPVSYDQPGNNGLTKLQQWGCHLLSTLLVEIKLRRNTDLLNAATPVFYLTFTLRGYIPVSKTDLCGKGLNPVAGVRSVGMAISQELISMMQQAKNKPQHGLQQGRVGFPVVGGMQQPVNAATGQVAYGQQMPGGFGGSQQMQGGMGAFNPQAGGFGGNAFAQGGFGQGGFSAQFGQQGPTPLGLPISGSHANPSGPAFTGQPSGGSLQYAAQGQDASAIAASHAVQVAQPQQPVASPTAAQQKK